MLRTLRDLWATNKLLLLGFTAALAVTLFFGIRAALFALYWNDPAHRNQTIEGWMTVGYVAKLWGVPRGVIVDTLTLPIPRDGKRVRLHDIALTEDVTLEDLRDRLNAAIAAHRTGTE